MKTRRIALHAQIWFVTGFLALGGCASRAVEPSPGRGLYSSFDVDRLAEVGWPNDLQQPYWWPTNREGEWGILYNAEGVPYGPNTYYHSRTPLDHPDFEMTDSTVTGRWFTMNRHGRAEDAMFARWLELHDLAHQEMIERLRYTPPMTIELYVAPELDVYRAVTGKEYWVTQVADGPFIAYEPMRTLWARTLALHAVRNGVVLAFLDLKCHGLVPPWLRQGLASYLAQEGSVLENFVNEFRSRREVLWPPEVVRQHIHPLYVREEGRIALYNAFLMTWNLAESYGWARIQDLLDLMEQGIVFEAAVPQVYGVSAQRLLELLDPREFGEPTKPKSPLEENPPATPDAASQPEAAPEKPEESPR